MSIRIGVVGVGRMGRRHVQIVQGLDLELVGVLDALPQSLEAAKTECGLHDSQLYTDLAALLAQKPDAMIIATTAPAHVGLTQTLAQAGVQYILCEKPMATSLEDCEAMIAVCQTHQAHLAINHYLRFLPLTQRIQAILSSEAFGGLTSMTISAANIGLAMVGSHYIEWFRYLAQEPLASVTAWLVADPQPNPRGPQFFDRAGSVRITTTGGKRLYMDIGVEQGHGVRMIFAGPYGQLVLDPFKGTLWSSVRHEPDRTLPTTRYAMPAVEETLTVEPIDAVAGSRAVLQALLAGEQYPSGHDALETIRAIVAAYASQAQQHTLIHLDGTLPTRERFPWA